MSGAHDPTRLGLELYTRDILNEEVGGLSNVPGSQVRRIAQRVVDMVLREDLPNHPGCSSVEEYVVSNVWGDGGSFPVGFDVAPDVGRIYVNPGDSVWVERVTPREGDRDVPTTIVHGSTRPTLELYISDILGEEVPSHPVGLRRAVRRIADMVIEAYTPTHVGLHRVIPVPVCPDCHAVMTKETDEDIDGVMHVHWTCQCEWDGEEVPTGPTVDYILLVCSRCGETKSPTLEDRGVELCPGCGYLMQLKLIQRGDRDRRTDTDTQPAHDIVTTEERGDTHLGTPEGDTGDDTD